jgi:hypothetical protein
MILQFPAKTKEKIEYFLSTGKVGYLEEDGEYDITQAFGIKSWIIPRVAHDYLLIKMKAKIKSRRQDDEKRILQYVNHLNRNYLPNSYYHEDGNLFGEYYLLGVITNSREQFLDTLSFCISAFKEAIHEDDRYNLISVGQRD